ncbi:MAG: YraN family protein [Polyangia bacterium]
MAHKTSTRDSGRRGEQLVCERLVERGMRILDRNVSERFAELDIVALDGDTLCFVEVRTRSDDALGHPAETITPTKQRKVRRAAEAYLLRHRIGPMPMRIDVATVVWNEMRFEYFENAF